MELQEVKELLRLLKATDFSEIEIEVEGLRLRVNRARGVVSPSVEVTPVISPTAPAPAPVVPPAPLPATVPADEATDGTFLQKSPMVGTFYRAPSPGAPPFVEVGGRVRPGQTLCIIEAMKLMNELEAEVAGTVLEILVQNGQPVEYGEPLFRIQPDR